MYNFQIISQAFSMLALRRKMLSPAATASLTMKLVDLALVSPLETYCEIIALLSTFSREALYSENNLLNTAVSLIRLNFKHKKNEILTCYILDFNCSIKFS